MQFLENFSNVNYKHESILTIDYRKTVYLFFFKYIKLQLIILLRLNRNERLSFHLLIVVAVVHIIYCLHLF